MNSLERLIDRVTFRTGTIVLTAMAVLAPSLAPPLV
jgi:hypothetical protein